MSDDWIKDEITARNNGGRFAPGNPGGPGRPKRTTEREYLIALTEACPPEAWQQIISRCVEDAKNGDAKAREWLARYLLGNPEAKAKTLLTVAIEQEVGIDPVARGVLRRRAALLATEAGHKEEEGERE
jgi:hypothetical protein